MSYRPSPSAGRIRPGRIGLAVALATCGALAFLAASAHAQGRPTGLRVSVTDIDHASSEVEFEVSLDTTDPIVGGGGLLGNQFVTPSYGYTAQLLSPDVPAVVFGDGETASTLVLPRLADGRYRGSFRHTYPGPGRYRMRAGATGMGMGPAASFPKGGDGNPVTADAWRFEVFSPFLKRDRVFSYAYPEPHVVGLTATPASRTPDGGAMNHGEGIVIRPAAAVDPVDAPSLSTFAQLLLATVLAALGWRFVAR